MGTEATEPRSRTRPAYSNKDSRDSFNPELVPSEYFLTGAGSLHPISNLDDQPEGAQTPSRIRHDESTSENDDSFNVELILSECFLTAGSLDPIFTVEELPETGIDSRKEPTQQHTKAADGA